MPNASAPNAPWVAVWLSPQTTVIPGWVNPCSGPITCDDALPALATSKSGMPNSAQLAESIAICAAACASRIGSERSVVGML